MKSITLMSKKKCNTPPLLTGYKEFYFKKKKHFNFFDCILKKLEIIINLHGKQLLKFLLDFQRAMEIILFLKRKKNQKTNIMEKKTL